MKAADVLVVPSHYEGLSYTMIEGLAAGLPIVTFEVSGSEEIVEHRRSGFIVPQGNEDLLANRVAKLVEDPDLRAQVGDAARQRFAEFSLRSMISRTESVYDDALSLTYERGKRKAKPWVFNS